MSPFEKKSEGGRKLKKVVTHLLPRSIPNSNFHLPSTQRRIHPSSARSWYMSMGRVRANGWSGIDSFFLINPTGKVIVEKHWRGIVDRSIVDKFQTRLAKCSVPEDLEPVFLTIEDRVLIHVYREGLFYLCVVCGEAPPLFVLEFLHSVVEICQDYFGDISEPVIKEHFVTVYQLLEEMMDDGYPITTESSVLKEFLPPPTMISKVISTVASVANVGPKPSGDMSSTEIPWRKLGIRYTNNEILFDIVEEIDAIIDRKGGIVFCGIYGTIMCSSRLTGMPDLVLSFINGRRIDDYSLHPCVRYKRFENDRLLSFVPPDGYFKLMNYKVNLPNQNMLPFVIRPQVLTTATGGKFDISFSPRNTEERPIENVLLILTLSAAVTSAHMSCNLGQYTFDPVSKTIRWTIGKITVNERIPMLSGTYTTSDKIAATTNMLTVKFQINLYTPSGVKIDALQVYSEPYKPYKGVRSVTKSGSIQMRL